MTQLTDSFVRSVRPTDKTQYLKDDQTKEFGLRVTKNGVKSFTVLLGAGNRVTLGRYPQLSLKDARAQAKRLLAERLLGGTPTKTAVPFADAKARFLSDCSKRLRPNTLDSYERMLRRYLPFDTKTLDQITPQQITRQLASLSPSNLEHATRVGKTFFRWCQRHQLIDHNPMEQLQAHKAPSRERILTDQELAEVYQTALTGDDSFSRLVVFLIRTGQRRGESSLLRQDWIDIEQGLIVFPSMVTKNKRVHHLPYLDHWGYANGGSGLVFPGQGGVPLAGWSKLKPSFDKKHTVRDYTLHDLRRTFSSGLARLGIPIHVTEKLLNHASGTHSGVQAIYNRYSYQDEMRDALLAWEHKLTSLVPPKG